MMKFSCIPFVVVALFLACSANDDSDISDASATEEAGPVNDDWDVEYLLKPGAKPVPMEEGMQFYDNLATPPQPVDDSGATEKHTVPQLVGWAVRGHFPLSDTTFANVLIPENCGDGRCGGGTQGITGLADAGILGQCGSFGISIADGVGLRVPDNSFKPCLLPYSRRASSAPNKTSWHYEFDTTHCGTGQYREQMLNGMRIAFRQASVNTGFSFTESTSGFPDTNAQTVKVYCTDGTSEATAGVVDAGSTALAFGMPFGPLAFAVDAPGAVEENCEGTPPNTTPHDPGYPVYESLFDGFWTYSHGRLAMNMFNIKNTIARQCATPSDVQLKAMFLWIGMHEIGHILGYQHQFGSTGRTTGEFPESKNIMQPYFACQVPPTDTITYRPLMQESMRAMDLPKTSDGVFTLTDNDLSCYEPTPQIN